MGQRMPGPHNSESCPPSGPSGLWAPAGGALADPGLQPADSGPQQWTRPPLAARVCGALRLAVSCWPRPAGAGWLADGRLFGSVLVFCVRQILTPTIVLRFHEYEF